MKGDVTPEAAAALGHSLDPLGPHRPFGPGQSCPSALPPWQRSWRIRAGAPRSPRPELLERGHFPGRARAP